MSTAGTEHEEKTETPERAFLVRTFEAVAVEVEGRTVDVRVVPFGEVATVSDPPHTQTYREQWMPGCFDHQVNAANRIRANVDHSPHVIDVVGHGISLRQESDGYHASFKIHKTNAGDTALEMLNDGALPAVSLEARPALGGSRRTTDGIVQRIKAHLRGIAFCREGAFQGAQVLAVREPPILDEELLPVDLDPETVERCRRLGIALPQRYQTHPAEADTPAESGTSEAAPVESSDNSTTLEEEDGRHEAE